VVAFTCAFVDSSGDSSPVLGSAAGAAAVELSSAPGQKRK
jgi:hypothetical protein